MSVKITTITMADLVGKAAMTVVTVTVTMTVIVVATVTVTMTVTAIGTMVIRDVVTIVVIIDMAEMTAMYLVEDATLGVMIGDMVPVVTGAAAQDVIELLLLKPPFSRFYVK